MLQEVFLQVCCVAGFENVSKVRQNDIPAPQCSQGARDSVAAAAERLPAGYRPLRLTRSANHPISVNESARPVHVPSRDDRSLLYQHIVALPPNQQEAAAWPFSRKRRNFSSEPIFLLRRENANRARGQRLVTRSADRGKTIRILLIPVQNFLRERAGCKSGKLPQAGLGLGRTQKPCGKFTARLWQPSKSR